MASIMMRMFAGMWALMVISACATAQMPDDIDGLFTPDARNGTVMRIEAAIATAQAEHGVISQAAAREISETADTAYAPLADVNAEYNIVRHRMVALLNVWRRSLSGEATDALHMGVTTVDIYDTVLVLQLLDSISVLEQDMLALEGDLLCLASQYRDTPMIGRTLGQHALPITFGKKVAVWAGQARRNIDRLGDVRARLRTSGVLKGAVGSHLGLGPHGAEIEARVSELLGLDTPEPADWRPARDVFAEYGQTLALIAASHAAIGGEVFRLQMTDIGEVHEQRNTGAVGSSTMPHKRNPSLSEALIYYGRTIPALSDVILEDVESVFERDNTSRANRTIEEITQEAGAMVSATRRLVSRLEVHPDRMRENLDRTGGMIMSQRIMLFLGQHMSRETAEDRLRHVATASMEQGISFRSALLADPALEPHLVADIDELLDPETSLGLAGDQVDRTYDWIVARRAAAGQPELSVCAQ